WQAQRSASALDDALTLEGQHKYVAAAATADHAHRIDPASLTPLWDKADIEIAAGKKRKAETLYQTAVLDQPSNPEAWTRLAEFELYRMGRPRQALSIVNGALYLDPRSSSAQTVFFDARRALHGGA